MLKFFCFALAAALAGTAPAFAQSSSRAGGAMPSCAAGDPVVWENTKSKAYHLPGDPYYGTTKHGKYACKSVADSAGYHASGTTGGKSSMHGAGASPMPAAPDAMSSAAPGTHPKHHHHHKGMASPEPSPT